MNSLSMHSEQKSLHVHIIPLGYEIDRAIRPFDSETVDRVYLLTMRHTEKKSTPKDLQTMTQQRYFESRVKEILLEQGIQVTIIRIDLFNILDVMNTIASIIMEEKKSNASVKVNMSTCGKITAFATIMASMAHDVSLYYVQADHIAENDSDIIKHGLSVCEQNRIFQLERIPFSLPQNNQMNILIKLASYQDGLLTSRIVDFLVENREPGFEEPFRDKSQDEMHEIEERYLSILENGFITPLLSAGYITQKKEGGFSRIILTPSGMYLVALRGSLPPVFQGDEGE